VSAPDTTTATRSDVPLFDYGWAQVGASTFREPQPAPEFIAHQILPAEIGGLMAPGGVGKTTLLLDMSLRLILGRPLFGHEVLRPGPVLILTAEDGLERVKHRLHRLGQSLNLTDAEIEKLGDCLFVEDMTGLNARFVESDQYGNLSQTATVDRLIETYREAGLVLIVIDPTVFFGPGERFVNDAEAALAQVGARIRRKLKCAVIFVHHTGKANARGGVVDQYAGRGGSALPDGLRFVWVLATHVKDDEDFKAPSTVPSHVMAEGRLLRLHIAKLTDAPRPLAPIWLQRSGFGFEVVEPTTESTNDRRAADLDKLRAFLAGELEQGIRYSKRSVEDEATRLGMGRNVVRSLVNAGLQKGLLVYRDLPDGGHGRFTHFIDPVVDIEVSAGGVA